MCRHVLELYRDKLAEGKKTEKKSSNQYERYRYSVLSKKITIQRRIRLQMKFFSLTVVVDRISFVILL